MHGIGHIAECPDIAIFTVKLTSNVPLPLTGDAPSIHMLVRWCLKRAALHLFPITDSCLFAERTPGLCGDECLRSSAKWVAASFVCLWKIYFL